MSQPSLPPSLWAATAIDAPDTPPLDGRAEAEVAVVGGGFCGLSAALHLAESGRSVVLVEAGEPGWGASGRNGGQVNPAWRLTPEEIAGLYGRDRAEQVVALIDGTCDLVFDLVARHGIDCEAVRPGFVQGAFGRYGRRIQHQWIEQWGGRGVAVERLDRQALRDLIGTGFYTSGLYDPRGGSLQPLSYARGLAHAALGAGAAIHGATRAGHLEPDGTGWRLDCGAGAVHCRQVLVCTNGYTDRLWPGLARTVVPVTSFLVASEPLDTGRLATILPGRHAVSETRRAIHYYKLDAAGRFVMGGRGNLTNVGEAGSADHLRIEARRIYPELEGVAWDYQWGGTIAVTESHAPMLLRLAEGVHAGIGFNGRGVAMATVMGRELARLVTGEEPALPVEAPRPIANHGLRQVGITWHLVAGRWQDERDRREDAGVGRD